MRTSTPSGRKDGSRDISSEHRDTRSVGACGASNSTGGGSKRALCLEHVFSATGIGPNTRESLVEHDPERVPIRGHIGPILDVRLFRRHVKRGPREVALRLLVVSVLQRGNDTKIEHDHVPRAVDKHIAGLYIPVEVPAPMKME